MKALRQHEFGGSDVLRDEEAPMFGLQSGVVRVHVVGLNPPDWYLRDRYKTLPPEWQPRMSFPVILGTDVSGVVAAVADDVKDFSVGDQVFFNGSLPKRPRRGWQRLRQYVSVPAAEVALKPAIIGHVHGAGARMSLLTAWQLMVELGHNETNPLQLQQHEPVPVRGKTVLVNGAAGKEMCCRSRREFFQLQAGHQVPPAAHVATKQGPGCGEP